MSAMWVLFALILLVDLPFILKKKNKRGIFVFFLLFVPALVLAILQRMNVQIPSLIMMLGNAVKSLGIYYRT